MKILSIDTSSSICAVSVLEDTNVIQEINLDDKKTHSENLMVLVKKILEISNIKLKDIDLIVCSTGPGSFTGIRIGVSAVKAMAEVLEKPVIGISSLDSLAGNEKVEDGYICSIINANNNQVYAGVYDKNINKVEDYIADDIENVIKILEKYQNESILFVGDGAEFFKDRISNDFQKALFTTNNTQSSVSQARIAYDKYKKGEIKTPDTLTPLYLRKSQAERMRDLKCTN